MYKIQKYLGYASLILFGLMMLFGVISLFSDFAFSIISIGMFLGFIVTFSLFLFNWVFFTILILVSSIYLKTKIKDFTAIQNKIINLISILSIVFLGLYLYALNNQPDSSITEFLNYGISEKEGIRAGNRGRTHYSSDEDYQQSLFKKAQFYIPHEMQYDKEVLIGFQVNNSILQKVEKNTNIIYNSSSNKFELEYIDDLKTKKQFIIKELNNKTQSLRDSSSIYWYIVAKPIRFGHQNLRFRLSSVGENNEKSDIYFFEKKIFIETPLGKVLSLLIIDFKLLYFLIYIFTFIISLFFFFKNFLNLTSKIDKISFEVKDQVKGYLQQGELRKALLILESSLDNNPIASPYIVSFFSEFTTIEKNELLNLLDFDTINRKKSELTYKILIFLDNL